jgi:hypothetical protein
MIKEEKEKIISFNLEKVAFDQPAELFCYVVILSVRFYKTGLVKNFCLIAPISSTHKKSLKSTYRYFLRYLPTYPSSRRISRALCRIFMPIFAFLAKQVASFR